MGDRPVPEPLVQVQPPRIRVAGAPQYEQRRRDEADERGDHQGERRIREREEQSGGRDQNPVGAWKAHGQSCPCTLTGARGWLRMDVPAWPQLLAPQHQTSPSVVNPQVCVRPTASCVNV